MSYIHFKSVCNQNFDKVTFDGVNLTLNQLKRLIFEKAKYNKNLNYDLEITNADTNEIYKSENDLIQKNSRVLVRRVIKNPTGPLRAQQSKSVTTPQSALSANRVAPPPLKQEPIQPTAVTTTSTITTATQNVTTDVKPSINSIAVDIKPQPTVQPEIRMETLKKTELMLPDIMTKPFNEPQKQQVLKVPNRPVPPNYICGHCKQPGHFKQFCPNVAAGLVQKEENRPKYPTGIPRSYMITVNEGAPGAMLGPEGYVIPRLDHVALKVVKKDKTPFLTDEEEEELKKGQNKQDNNTKVNTYIPPHLTCPFEEHGKHIIKDAVLVPCCGYFICCDECIKEKISHEEVVECPIKSCGYEIDSLESITSHHQVREMVNEYLNDVKLNKINNNNYNTTNSNGSSNSSSSNTNKSDAFIDSLLEFEFNTKPPAQVPNVTVVNKDSSSSISSVSSETITTVPVGVTVDKSKKLDGEDDEDLLFNLNDEGSNTVGDGLEVKSNGKSPVQDSNISSTIALANKIDAAANAASSIGALLPTPPVSQLLVSQQPVQTVPTTIPANNIQRIGTVTKPPILPVNGQYVDGYNPYMMHNRPPLGVVPPTGSVNINPVMNPMMKTSSVPVLPPNKMRRLPNNIPIQTHPVPIRYGNGMMHGGPYDMPSTSTYYTNGYGYPQATMAPMYSHPQMHGYGGNMAPNGGYGPGGYGIPPSGMNQPGGFGLQKKLTEEEFYEVQERLRRGHHNHHNSDLHTFVSDIIDKKKRRSTSRSITRSRSRGRRSRSNSYSSGSSNYNSRRRYNDRHDNYRQQKSGRVRRSNSKTHTNRQRRSYSRSSSRSNSSYNKRRIRRSRSKSHTKQEKTTTVVVAPIEQQKLQQVNDTENVKFTKFNNESSNKTSSSDKQPLTSKVEKVVKSKHISRSRSKSAPRISSKIEKSRSNSKSKQIISSVVKNETKSTREKERDKEKDKKSSKYRSRSRSTETTKKEPKLNDTQEQPVIKSVVKKPSSTSDNNKQPLKSTVENKTTTTTTTSKQPEKIKNDKRKSETAELDKDLDENRKKSKKENTFEEESTSKKSSKKDKKEKGDDDYDESEKKSKHKKSKKKHKNKHHSRSVSREKIMK